MTRFGYAMTAAVATELFGGLFVAIAVIGPRPLLLWNASASAPVGLYRLRASAPVTVGDLVAIQPPAPLAHFLAEREYLPARLPLLKHVAATAGASVCRFGRAVAVDGQLVATARDRDSRGRPLPAWRGCRTIGEKELFLLNVADDSLDSRYFGPIPAGGLLARAVPILTRDAPGGQLRWRGIAADPSLEPTKKGAV